MWSVGVTVYILLSGTPPFWTDHQTEALMKILSASYDFDLPVWQNVSETAKDFIRNTIVANPKRRMTVTQALEHPWITVPNHSPLWVGLFIADQFPIGHSR